MLQPGVVGGNMVNMRSVVLSLQDCLPSHKDLTLASTAGPASQPLRLNAAQFMLRPDDDPDDGLRWLPTFGCPKLAKSTVIVPVPGRQLSCMTPGAKVVSALRVIAAAGPRQFTTTSAPGDGNGMFMMLANLLWLSALRRLALTAAGGVSQLQL